MVRGDRVAQQCQDASARDVCDRLRVTLQCVEVGSLAHVGARAVPREDVPFGCGEALPTVVSFENIPISAGEHLCVDGCVNGRLNLIRARPDICQIDRSSILRRPQRLSCDVEIHRPRDRVGDHQRRGCEVVHLDVGVDTSFEITISTQDRRDRQIGFVDGRAYLGNQRPGIADTRRAAVTHDVEAKLL